MDNVWITMGEREDQLRALREARFGRPDEAKTREVPKAVGAVRRTRSQVGVGSERSSPVVEEPKGLLGGQATSTYKYRDPEKRRKQVAEAMRRYRAKKRSTD